MAVTLRWPLPDVGLILKTLSPSLTSLRALQMVGAAPLLASNGPLASLRLAIFFTLP
jgi:hypothetical protein